MLLALAGAVVLEVLVVLRLLHLFLTVEDAGHVQLLHHLAPALLPAYLQMYFLNSRKMDINSYKL